MITNDENQNDLSLNNSDNNNMEDNDNINMHDNNMEDDDNNIQENMDVITSLQDTSTSSNEHSLLGKRNKNDRSIEENEENKKKREKLGLRERKRKVYSDIYGDGLDELNPIDIKDNPPIENQWIPRVEKILAHRYNDNNEIEYYVKWKNRSYIHTSWVGPEEFSHERYSKRKLIRYHKKDELLYDETDEIFNPAFVEVDRILCHYDGIEPGVSEKEYLVKWEQCPYTDATWEFMSDIKDDNKIKLYHDRQIPPNPKSWKKKKRPPPSDWKEYKESPKYNNNNLLRSYQLEGLNWLSFCWYNKRNSILADEMGLGKTVQTVALLNHLYKEVDMHGPFLIVAPLITVPHWQREFEGWTDMSAIVYHGTAAAREMIRKYEWGYSSIKDSPPPFKFNVLITTYEMILTDVAILSKINWSYLAVDEAHRLKNSKCKLITSLRLFHFDHLLLLTGTPLQNNTEELWTLLNFMDPIKFASAEEFSYNFGDLKETSQVEELHQVLRPYLLRRMKEDVEKSIAPKEETIVEVELTTIQKRYYRAIFERNFSSLNMGAKTSNIPSLLNIMMQLRKCCNHPYLIRGVEENIVKQYNSNNTIIKNKSDENELMINSCGKLVLVDKLLAKLKEGGHKVLIFSQMIRMLDILEDYLLHKGYLYERIDGNKRGNERQEAIDRFSAPDSDRFVFLLCTRAGGLGINLTAADTCIIYDSDWNPQNDIQAQARCHRIGQTQKVKIYRLITRNTYEKVMFQKASLKLGLDQVVLTKMNNKSTTSVPSSNMTTNAALRAMDKKEIEELLRFGAYKTFTDQNNNEKFLEEDIDQILERNSTTIIHNSDNNTNSKLSSFSKASFISANAESNAHIDVTDPDFWNKLIPGNYSKDEQNSNITQNKDNNHVSDDSSSDNSIKSRYSLRDTSDRFPLYDPYLSFSDPESPEVDANDDNFENFQVTGTEIYWSSRERAKIKTTLAYYGYGQWTIIKDVGNLQRWTIPQIKSYSDSLISNCASHISEDPDTLLKYLQKWCIYSESSDAIIDKDKASHFDYSYDPSLTDPNFSLYKPTNAKLFIRKLENISKISKAVIECYNEYGEELIVPPSLGETPCPSWTSNDDKSLILGTYYHGYGRYEKMRTDNRLSFSRFILSTNIIENNNNNSMDIDNNNDNTMDIDNNDNTTTNVEEWPIEKLLHRQLRKILRVIAIDEDTYVPDTKIEQVDEMKDINNSNNKSTNVSTIITNTENKKRRTVSNHEWSKREKQAVYRYIVTFGLPETNDNDGWNDLKNAASLTRKDIEQTKLYCDALVDTAEIIADKDRKTTSKDWSKYLEGDLKLTKAQSKRLVHRVRIFKDLREYLFPRLEELPKLLKTANTTGLPPWWCPESHDYALIRGIVKHGFGQWEKLCSDKLLPYYSIAEEYIKLQKSNKNNEDINEDNNYADDNGDLEIDESHDLKQTDNENIIKSNESNNNISPKDNSESDDDEVGDDNLKKKRGRKADIYTTALSFPKEKAILRRLRYLIKFINDSNLPPVNTSGSIIPKRIPLKLSTDSLSLSSKDLPQIDSPRSSRKHKICAGRKPAKKKYHEIPKNEDGSPIFPVVFGKMRIESLGTVIYDKPGFHNDRYIWPVGYRSVRPYQSFINPSTRTEYTSEILDGGDRPLFKVTASDAPDYPGEGNSPTAAWTGILRKLNEKSNKPFNAVSGPEYFGLAKGIVSKLIQELPNADKCFNYQKQEFILDKTPQSRKKRKTKTPIPDKVKPQPNTLNIPPNINIPRNIPTIQQNVTQTIPQNMQHNIPQNIPQNIQQNMHQNIPQNSQQNISPNITKTTSQPSTVNNIPKQHNMNTVLHSPFLNVQPSQDIQFSIVGPPPFASTFPPGTVAVTRPPKVSFSPTLIPTPLQGSAMPPTFIPIRTVFPPENVHFSPTLSAQDDKILQSENLEEIFQEEKDINTEL